MAASVCFYSEALTSLLPKEMIRKEGPSLREHWHLCALSYRGAQDLIHVPLSCQTLLVPVDMYRPLWQARQVVSYGLSNRSSLTLSSMDRHDMLCVQRTLVDRLGRPMEAQELPLPASWHVFSPAERLLLAGIWLLWGKM